MGAKAARLEDVHRLRGVAILLVVASHCYAFFSWGGHPLLEAFAKDLCDDSTVLFVFIGGYLFQHLEAERFSYGAYLKRKLFTVWVPYLIAAAPAIAYAMLRSTHAFDDGAMHAWSPITKIFYLLIYGGSTLNYPLWFIPVVTIYYVAAPALHALGNGRRSALIGVTLALLALSALMHRPAYGHDHNLALALYFLSAFVLGIGCSRYRVATQRAMHEHLGAMLVVTAAAFVGHLLLSDHHGKYVSPSSFAPQEGSGWIDWIYLQKILLTLTIFALMGRLDGRLARVLRVLGSASFTIYFFHAYVLYVMQWLMHSRDVPIDPVAFIVVLVIAIGVPCGIALGSKRALPRWSRSLVGA